MLCGRIARSSIVLLLCTVVAVKTCPTYISIWPSGKTSYEATIQARWDQNCDPKPNWIKLFNSDPSLSDPFPRFVVDVQNNRKNQILIDNRIGRIALPGGWNRREAFAPNATRPKTYPRGRCLDYYVASFHDDELLSVNCLKVQPNWMRLNEHVMEIPLKHLFIPGTHSSGSYYNITKKGSIKLERYFHTQNFDVWTQLVFGVRYLDLNIGYNSKLEVNKDNFWIITGDTLVNHLNKILDDIKKFIEISSEVVLIDFNDFEFGSENDVVFHQLLVNRLEEELGYLTLKPSMFSEVKHAFDLPLNQIVRSGKHIVMMYPTNKLKEYNIDTDLFWPSLKKIQTENINDTEILETMRKLFSGRTYSNNESEGFVFHATRGHNLLPYINGKISTTRERAMSINTKIEDWLRGPWSLKANVLTTDFIMSTNIIELAVSTNRYRAYQIANDFVSFTIV